jgi:hypothetical protein
MYSVGIGLLLAAGTVLAQDTPPQLTGIQMTGSVSIIRAEGMIPSFLPGTPPSPSLTETFITAFQTRDYTNYVQPPPPDPSTIQTIGPCTVVQLTLPATPATGIVITPLDAGPVINVTGPSGMKSFPVNKGSYGGTLGGGGIPLPIPGLAPPSPPWVVPGAYTVDNGSGGADIGPFTANLTVPDPLFEWTNPDANLTITRSAGVDVQFSGGDPNSPVTIQGVVSLFDSSFKVTGGASFTCIVPNTGDFVVTSDVLNLLPATVPSSNPAVPTSTLTVEQGLQASFNAPVATTSNFYFSTGVARSVTYQ